MSIDHYTPIHFNKRHAHASQFFSIHFEPLILSLLVLIGFIGSIYLFGQKFVSGESSQLTSGNSNGSPVAAMASLFAAPDEEAPANAFNDYVSIESKVKAGERFTFQFLKDEKASRFVMEMGDGVRLIVTQKQLLYEYAAPGVYIIELKELKDGLLHIIGTKKIKVK
ncbi:MAG: hypothetical protein U0T36_02630 [Saprospiraceae bacterium]|jgi:hypothetical protein